MDTRNINPGLSWTFRQVKLKKDMSENGRKAEQKYLDRSKGDGRRELCHPRLLFVGTRQNDIIVN